MRDSELLRGLGGLIRHLTLLVGNPTVPLGGRGLPGLVRRELVLLVFLGVVLSLLGGGDRPHRGNRNEPCALQQRGELVQAAQARLTGLQRGLDERADRRHIGLRRPREGPERGDIGRRADLEGRHNHLEPGPSRLTRHVDLANNQATDTCHDAGLLVR